ncbi:hypothetical protein [Neochlamydia sp. EPS4]|uniref:hypothetical protein n=1 Tax=Neochlamydia sp. EPS4 TaxID=1478175 RepID=UPI000694F29B|nr:hypothetical protein [Neochlamydia sp. EPS4]
MKSPNFRNQLYNNAVAIISLIVAVIALAVNTWRLEQTERNRNTRQAGFEMLKNLGGLQAVVNTTLYKETHSKIEAIEGWNYIAMMSDIVILLPSPVPENLKQLAKIWSVHWKNLATNHNGVSQVNHQIDTTREAVMHALNQLH